MTMHPLSPGGNTLVILDACVLLPSRLSDVLFDLMLEGLYFAYWTSDVEAEFLRNWPQVHPDASKSGAKRLKVFQRAVNNAHLITGYADTRKLGIEVIKAGAFLDRLCRAAPARTNQAIAKALNDLTKPPYSKAELAAALRLHGAKATADGLERATG